MEKTKLLENLRITIEQDPSYFPTAKANLLKTDGVNELLEKMKQEAKTRAESAIAEVETVFLRTPEIEAKVQNAFEKLRKSSVLKANFKIEDGRRKHKRAEQLLEVAIIKTASGKYEEIIKANLIAKEAKTTLIESHILLNSALDIAITEEKKDIEEENLRINTEKRLAEEREILHKKEEVAEQRRKEHARNELFNRRIKKLPSIVFWSLIGGWFLGLIIGVVIGYIIYVIILHHSDDIAAEKIVGTFAFISVIILMVYFFISGIKNVK